MDSYDKIEELLLAEGYSKEEIPSIMVSLVEQGISPDQIFATGLADMLGFNNKTKVKPKMTTTQQSGGMLGQRNVRTVKDLGGAPRPEFGPNAVKPPTGATTPSLRPGGRTPAPNFKVSNTTTPRTPVPSVPTTPKLPASKPNLFGRLKSLATPQNLVRGIRGIGGSLGSLGAQTVGLELATKLAQSAGRPGQSKMSRLSIGGNAPVYNTPLSPNNVADAKASGYVPDRGILGIKDKIEKSTPPASVSATQRQVNTDNQKYGNTVPAGSFGISAKGKAQAAANRAEYAANRANTKLPAPKPPAPKPPTAQERAYGSRSKLTTDQQAMNKKYDELRGLKGGRVTTPNSPALNSFLAKRGLK